MHPPSSSAASTSSTSSADNNNHMASAVAASPPPKSLARPQEQLFSNGYHPQLLQDGTTLKEKAWSEDSGVMVENNTPSMMLKCADCGICKCNSEDMEIHIKMEHLNWLPFQCPVCSCQRASDAQMREHLHSSHRSNTTLFHYVDNVAAKRRLQKLMDDSLSHAIGRKRKQMNGAATASATNFATVSAEDLAHVTSDDSGAGTPMGSSPLHQSVTVQLKEVPRKRAASHMLPSTYTDALLANIQAATQAAAVGDGIEESMTPEQIASDPVLDAFFGSKRVKSEFDVDEENSMGGGVGVLDSSSVLDDVAALFTSDGRLDDMGDDKYTSLLKSATSSFKAAMMANLVNGGASPSNGSSSRGANTPRYAGSADEKRKKRVLGECSKCQKPVTAGARQMHMFFHLGKDYNIYRFRCKYAGCAVEHYRKDQMENHHSKQHGKIDPDMMEDRSLELFQRCQELSVELLGTNGSQPGPTAARALVNYNSGGASVSSPLTPSAVTALQKEEGGVSSGSMIDDHPLECRLCHKTMQNRIRGFHILWHMAKDLGINRYTCKLCDFGHDRSQSVQTHGKREHAREDIVEDRIDEYTEEVKQMSEACFGYQALFSAESRRRSKIPLASLRVKEEDDDGEENDENEEGSVGGEEEEEDEMPPVKKEKKNGQLSIEDINDLPPLLKLAAAMGSTPVSKDNKEKVKRKEISKEVRMQMAKLREVSMLLGGAQYFKKKINDKATCMRCGMLTPNRMSDHVYKHLNAYLFCCPHCELGHYSREIVVRHIRDMHRSSDLPIDKRLQFANQIKEMVRTCYPQYFVDAPLPTEEAINRLKSQIGAGDFNRIVGEKEDDEEKSQGDSSPLDASSLMEDDDEEEVELKYNKG